MRSFSLCDVERKFVHIFVLQNLSNIAKYIPQLKVVSEYGDIFTSYRSQELVGVNMSWV